MKKNEIIGREKEKSAQKQKEKAGKIPKQSFIKVHQLQQYISSVYVGCSMPPLNQLLELQLNQDEVVLKLRDLKNEKFGDEDKAEYVYYLERGKVILKKKKDGQVDDLNRNRSQMSGLSSKMSSNQGKQKTIQVKQNNFFMLTSINTKRNNGIEYYYIDSYQTGEYNKCFISKIKVNSNFDMNWYMMESEKYQFVSSLFRSQNQSISEHKLKGLSRFFKFQTFRRGMIITSESQENQRLCIIKTGECQFTKTFSYKTKNHSDIKVLKIANAGPKAVLQAQFALFQFMGSSKNVSIATKAMGELQNKIQNIGFKMYEKSKNNFAVTVLSAYTQVYYISVAKFKELCEKYVPEAPQQLRKNIQSNYITLLRTTKQKLDLELLKLQRNDHKTSEQRDILEAKLMSGHFINEEPHNQYESQSPIKLKRSEFYETNLQQETVQKNRSRKLQKKIELILHEKKVSVNYKKKIEIVLKEKLTNKRIFESPVLKNFSATNQIQQVQQQTLQNSQNQSPQAKKIQNDLQSIFMNNQNNYRSNSIERQNSILSKKQNLLKKRYQSMANTLIVHEQFYDKNKNKVFRMDLIRKGAIDPKKQLREKEKQKEREKRERDKDKQKDSKAVTGTNFTERLKNNCLEKINRANRIKQQFMTIRSECENCHCYDDIESYLNTGSQKDIKMQTMKTGSAWRSVDSKTAYDQSLEKLHSKIKLVSEKSSRKYNHNMHLLETKRRFMSGSHRKLSGLI